MTTDVNHLLQQPVVLTAIQALGKDRVRLVGGAVRDLLLGLKPDDLDMATSLKPEQVMTLLREQGEHVIPTGLAHGTVTLIQDSIPLEITTLRQDLETDGRHATVAFTDDWKEDAKRRDFTFNALALTMDGELIDYFGGEADLKSGIVRFVGDARQRIQEDHLRILRYFRFLARFGKQDADPATCTTIKDLAQNLAILSGERIQKEMHGLLAVPSATSTLKLMSDLDIDTVLFGHKFDMALYNQLTQNELIYDRPRPIRRLATLLGRKLAPIANAAKTLRLSKVDSQRLLSSADENEFLASMPLHETLYRFGAELVLDQILLKACVCREQIQRVASWQRPIFPVTGKDLINLGFTSGVELGQIKRKLEGEWIASNFLLSKDALLAMV